jgi:hypothetical protein
MLYSQALPLEICQKMQQGNVGGGYTTKQNNDEAGSSHLRCFYLSRVIRILERPVTSVIFVTVQR